MAIKLVKLGISGGVGIADIVTEYIDVKQGYRKSFQRVTDWARVAYTVGGYAANEMDLEKGSEKPVTESMVLSGIPLLTKSIYNATREYVIKGMRKGKMGLKLKDKGRGSPGSPGGSQIRYV